MAKELTDSHRALRLLAEAMLLGLVSVVVYAWSMGGWEGFLGMMSVGILLAGASAFAGGALGFLFGIPRTLQQEGLSPIPEGQPSQADGSALLRRIDYRVNTNLEQISDWLTKILVGVGLAEFTQIREWLISLTAFAAQGLGPQSHAQVFAFALLTYSAVLGFLFGYLWTRLFLVGALRVADQAALGALVEKVHEVTQKAETTERKLEELKTQSERDAAALNLVYRQLNPSKDVPAVVQADLDAAVAAASRPVKVQIFNQAWQIRSENWRDPNNKPRMELTIPLFRALLHSDPEDHYHTNHGQLGFALKDKVPPDWAEAEKELSRAIEIRDSQGDRSWRFYEFNRAVCRIQLEHEFQQNLPSGANHRAQILSDLREAARAEGMMQKIRDDSLLQKWMTLNKVKERDLRRV